MSRTLVILLVVAAIGMPFIGFQVARALLPPKTETAAVVSVAETAELQPAAEATAVGGAPTKRVVASIEVDGSGDLQVAQTETTEQSEQQIQDTINAAGSETAPAEQPAVEAPAAETPSAETPVVDAACKTVDQLTDKDGDFTRNEVQLKSAAYCIEEDKFKENGANWVVHIIRTADKKPGPLWVVPHDNENVGFDNALWGVANYGGTMVSVETGGKRFNGEIDPNRIFTGDKKACGRQSPHFTELFWNNRDPAFPVIGLHSNDSRSSSTGGKGGVSIEAPLPNTVAIKADPPIVSQSAEDTVVFVASLENEAGKDPIVDSMVQALHERGLNVLREHVTAKNNDCSFSNYAALNGVTHYYNLEVLHDDGATQREMIKLVMGIGDPTKLPPAPAPAAAPEEQPAPVEGESPPPAEGEAVPPAEGEAAPVVDGGIEAPIPKEPIKRGDADLVGTDATIETAAITEQELLPPAEVAGDDPAPTGCREIKDLTDKDGDFKRNAKRISSGKFCIEEHKFTENGVGWVVHVIQRAEKTSGPLWAVPHDNENAAFDSGIWAVETYGGTMVSVETGGNRENKGIDPNRNFTGNAKACGRTSPKFTALFTDHSGNGRIIGLHSNTPGGSVSVNGSLPHTTPIKAPNPFIGAKSQQDTLVFVASTKPRDKDPAVDRIVQSLLDNNLNVMLELVSKKSNDCSFSNYAALRGLSNYLNLEVVHGDSAAQRKMIEVVMKL